MWSQKPVCRKFFQSSGMQNWKWIIQFSSVPRQNRSSLLPVIYLIMYLIHLEIFWKSLKRKFLSELLYFCRTHICSGTTNFAVLYIFVKLHVFCIPITWVYWENIYISNLKWNTDINNNYIVVMYHYNKFHSWVINFCSFKEHLRLFTIQKNLDMPWNPTAHIWKKLGRSFPIFDNNPKNVCVFPVTNCEAKLSVNISNFSKLSKIKNKVRSMMLEERIIFFFSLRTDITKSLAYEGMIKKYMVKKHRKVFCRGLLGS